MPTSLLAGLPMLTCPSAVDNASTSSPAIAAGAMMRRIAVHFCPALLVISLTTSFIYRSNSGVPGHGVRTEYRRVERIGLGGERDGLADDAGMLLQCFGRGLRAGEGDRVLAVEVIEQVTDAAANQLQASRRQ